MTDGIIQQIFEKWLLTNDSGIFTTFQLELIEGELIEKIELIHPLHNSAFCSTCEIKKYLIGDNQE